MRRRRSASRFPPPASHPGFALVEVVVAVVLLTCGALAVVAGTGMAIRATAAAERQSATTSVARSRVEMLAAAACLGLRDSVGTDSSQFFSERWVVRRARNGTRLVTDSVFYLDPAGGQAIALDRLVVC